MHTIDPRFEYDPAKNAANMLKHRVGFSEAATCFDDQHALILEDAVEGELRWLAFGYSDRGRILAVSFTVRGDVNRLISARKATAREKDTYARRI